MIEDNIFYIMFNVFYSFEYFPLKEYVRMCVCLKAN